MLEEMFLKRDVNENLVGPYLRGDKKLGEAIEDFYKNFFDVVYNGEDGSEFSKARDIFDSKMTILQHLIQLKRFNEVKEDYKVLLEYFNKAIAEFEEALKAEEETNGETKKHNVNS